MAKSSWPDSPGEWIPPAAAVSAHALIKLNEAAARGQHEDAIIIKPVLPIEGPSAINEATDTSVMPAYENHGIDLSMRKSLLQAIDTAMDKRGNKPQSSLRRWLPKSD